MLSSFRDGDKDSEIWNCLHCQIGGQRKLWQALIGTKKKLDICVGAMKKADHHICVCRYLQARTDLRQALEQINQKE